MSANAFEITIAVKDPRGGTGRNQVGVEAVPSAYEYEIYNLSLTPVSGNEDVDDDTDLQIEFYTSPVRQNALVQPYYVGSTGDVPPQSIGAAMGTDRDTVGDHENRHKLKIPYATLRMWRSTYQTGPNDNPRILLEFYFQPPNIRAVSRVRRIRLVD